MAVQGGDRNEQYRFEYDVKEISSMSFLIKSSSAFLTPTLVAVAVKNFKMTHAETFLKYKIILQFL